VNRSFATWSFSRKSFRNCSCTTFVHGSEIVNVFLSHLPAKYTYVIFGKNCLLYYKCIAFKCAFSFRPDAWLLPVHRPMQCFSFILYVQQIYQDCHQDCVSFESYFKRWECDNHLGDCRSSDNAFDNSVDSYATLLSKCVNV
jgi:hypothetical protein